MSPHAANFEAPWRKEWGFKRVHCSVLIVCKKKKKVHTVLLQNAFFSFFLWRISGISSLAAIFIHSTAQECEVRDRPTIEPLFICDRSGIWKVQDHTHNIIGRADDHRTGLAHVSTLFREIYCNSVTNVTGVRPPAQVSIRPFIQRRQWDITSQNDTVSSAFPSPDCYG